MLILHRETMAAVMYPVLLRPETVSSSSFLLFLNKKKMFFILSFLYNLVLTFPFDFCCSF